MAASILRPRLRKVVQRALRRHPKSHASPARWARAPRPLEMLQRLGEVARFTEQIRVADAGMRHRQARASASAFSTAARESTLRFSIP